MAAQVVPVVADVVKRQVGIGLDCIGDGEYWSALDIKWFDQQMTGLSTRLLKTGEVGSMRESTRERDVNGPIKSRGTAATRRQLDCFKAAIARSGVALDEAFVPALAPGWLGSPPSEWWAGCSLALSGGGAVFASAGAPAPPGPTACRAAPGRRIIRS